METLFNGFTLQIAPGTFPLSTDSMALAAYVRMPKNARILDLGAGCATLGVMLCAHDPSCTVTGVEIDPVAHEAALENARRNGIAHRLSSICADLAQFSLTVEPGSFDICVSNPPYFTAGPHSRATPLARHEATCSLGTLIGTAARALRYGGDLYLVHKPERLSEIFVCASANKLEPKRLCLLRHREDSPIALVMVQCRKGGKPGLLWEEAALFQANGEATDFYRQMYHMND